MMYTANDSAKKKYCTTEMTSTTTYLKPHNETFITGDEGLNSSNHSMSSFMSGLLSEREMKFDTSSIFIVDDNARSVYDRRSMNLVKLRRPKSSIGLNRWGGDSDDEQPVVNGHPCYSRRLFSSSTAPLQRAGASDTMLLKKPVRRESPIVIKPLLGNFQWDQSNATALRINKFDILFEESPKRKTSSSTTTTTTTTTTTGLKKSKSSSSSTDSSSGLKSSEKKKSLKRLKERANVLGLDLQ
jgi:hypothetical protein